MKFQGCMPISGNGCSSMKNYTTTDSSENKESSTIDDRFTLSTSQSPIYSTTTDVTMPHSESTTNNKDITVTEEQFTTSSSNGNETTTDIFDSKQSTTTDNSDIITNSQNPVEITSPTTDVDDSDIINICPPNFVGVIPDPEMCDRYYYCTGGRPQTLYCAPGYEFDNNNSVSFTIKYHNIMSCHVISNVLYF